MKVLSVLLIIGLVLGGCTESPYNGERRVEKYPVKYEYRCLRSGECKYINANYEYEKVIKDKYKNLSKEELEKKDKEFNNKVEIIAETVFFGVPIATGVATAVNTTINVGGGNRSCYRCRSRSSGGFWNFYVNSSCNFDGSL